MVAGCWAAAASPLLLDAAVSWRGGTGGEQLRRAGGRVTGAGAAAALSIQPAWTPAVELYSCRGLENTVPGLILSYIATELQRACMYAVW